jgi:RNA polymerase sigma-70 factor (ECF subfamily)
MAYGVKTLYRAKVDISRQLLMGAQRGDGLARDDLLIASREYLSGIARQRMDRSIQSKVDASDLVQETIVAAHRHFARFRGSTEAEFAVWLRTILAARIANARRHFAARRRDTRRELSLSSSEHTVRHAISHALAADAAASPSDQAVGRERTERISLAMTSLPSHYSEVIRLRVFEDLAFAEVAERMGRSVDSVEKLWGRALKLMREVLGGDQKWCA